MNDQSKVVTQSDLLAIIAQQKSALDALQAKLDSAPVRKTSLKVSEKGAISLFGGNIRKFGATFYAAEWETILAQADTIRDFIKTNTALVSRK